MSSEQAQNLQTEIGFAEIMQFLKMYRGKIFVTGILSILATAVFILAAYFLIPKQSVLMSEITMQLQNGKNMRGQISYPSETPFSANDLLSPAVLRKVYEDNKLAEKIEFKDFCELFNLSQTNIKKAMVLAEFNSKLSKKLTLVELSKIQDEYNKALQSLPQNIVGISMLPSLKLSKAESVKILNSIPVAWFDIYSKQEAKSFPVIETPQQIKALRAACETDGHLVFLDKSRLACKNLILACKELDEMMPGQKITLPSGELLADLNNSLDALNNYRINPLLLLTREIKSLQSPFDKIFLQANIIESEKQIKAEQSKLAGTLNALNILMNKKSATAGSTVAGKVDSGSMTMNLDGNFFQELQNLIRRSENNYQKVRYAEQALKLEFQIATLNAEKDYYTTLEKHKADAKNSTQLSVDDFKKMEEAMFNELLNVSTKMNAFRDLIFKNQITRSKFFTVNGEVLEFKDFPVPFKRIALGVILLVVLGNILYAGKMFYEAYASGKLSAE